jgi:hypothetical protein
MLRHRLRQRADCLSEARQRIRRRYGMEGCVARQSSYFFLCATLNKEHLIRRAIAFRSTVDCRGMPQANARCAAGGAPPLSAYRRGCHCVISHRDTDIAMIRIAVVRRPGLRNPAVAIRCAKKSPDRTERFLQVVRPEPSAHECDENGPRRSGTARCADPLTSRDEGADD